MDSDDILDRGRYVSFKDNQNRRYQAHFGERIVIEKGIAPSTVMTDGICGYAFLFRHPESITEPVTEFADRLSRVVPVVTYDGMTIHTTLGLHDVPKEGLKPGESFHPEAGILDSMCDIVHSLIGDGLLDESYPWISYRGSPKEVWRYNSDSVIVAGQPNQAFVDAVFKLYVECAKKSLELRSAWGAHITAARFTHKRTLAKLVDFLSLIKTAPRLDESRMQCIDVVSYDISSKGISIEVHERFE